MPTVEVKSYVPAKKRERSKLQQVKDKYRSYNQINKEGLPKDLNEIKSMKLKEHALTFLNQSMNIDKKTSKTQYCKTHHISHHSLNTGLNLLGCKNRIKRESQSPVEPNRAQLSPVETQSSTS